MREEEGDMELVKRKARSVGGRRRNVDG